VPVQRLTTSALLARYRVGSLLVEKRREVFSLEILRRLGLGEAVHAVADGVSDMVVKPTLNNQTGADTTLGAAHRPRAGRSTAQWRAADACSGTCGAQERADLGRWPDGIDPRAGIEHLAASAGVDIEEAVATFANDK
jgi:hypothetical protein